MWWWMSVHDVVVEESVHDVVECPQRGGGVSTMWWRRVSIKMWWRSVYDVVVGRVSTTRWRRVSTAWWRRVSTAWSVHGVLVEESVHNVVKESVLRVVKECLPCGGEEGPERGEGECCPRGGVSMMW